MTSNRVEKPCRACGELILLAARKCRFCGEWVSSESMASECRLEISREDTRYGSSMALELRLNDVQLGELATGETLSAMIPRGVHLLDIRTSKRWGDPLVASRKLTVDSTRLSVTTGLADGAVYIEGDGVKEADADLIAQHPMIAPSSSIKERQTAGGVTAILVITAATLLFLIGFQKDGDNERTDDQSSSMEAEKEVQQDDPDKRVHDMCMAIYNNGNPVSFDAYFDCRNEYNALGGRRSLP